MKKCLSCIIRELQIKTLRYDYNRMAKTQNKTINAKKDVDQQTHSLLVGKYKIPV